MAATVPPTIHLRAEFKPLLSMINILVEFPRTVIEASPRLTVESHTITLKIKQVTTVFHLHHLIIKPVTCRGLRWNSETELQLTLQAEWHVSENISADGDKLNSAGHGDKLNTSNQFHPFNQDLLVSKIKSCQSRCFCVGCGAQIFKSSCNFARVLPLPSENWTDFADIWFCHNHTNGTTHSHCHNGENTLPDQLKRVKDSGLSPRFDDCLVSSLYMLVSARQVKACAVMCTNDRLVCKRCGNFLGFVKLGDGDIGNHNLPSYFHDPFNGVYKLYFHAVSFRDNFEEVPLKKKQTSQGLDSNNSSSSLTVVNWDQSIEGYLCNLLKDQSHSYTSFRFIIDSAFQGEGTNSVIILLWLLDQELAVFLSSSTLPSLLQQTDESTSQPSSSELPSPPSEVISHHVTPCKYMKVLYKATFQPLNGYRSVPTLSPSVFTAWQKDNTVHGLSLPNSLCKQLISLLVSSTKQLAKSQRNLNGFHVGYLKAS